MEEKTYSFSGLVRECLKNNRPDISKQEDVDWKQDLNYWVPLFEKTIFKALGISDFYNEYKKAHNNKFNQEWYDFIEKLYFINSPAEEDKTRAAMDAKKDLRVPLNKKHTVINYNYDELFKLLSNAVIKSGDNAQYFMDKLNKTDQFIKRYREHIETDIYSEIKQYLTTIENSSELSNEEKRQKLNKFHNSVLKLTTLNENVTDEVIGFVGYFKTDNNEQPENKPSQEG